MRYNLVDKILFSTLLMALACLTGGLFSNHFPEGLALFCGAIWGTLNLFLLKIFLKRLLLQSSKKDLAFLLLILAKWPLLYFGGYALLKTQYLSSTYLLIGFSSLFGVIFILGLLSLLLGKKYENRNS